MTRQYRARQVGGIHASRPTININDAIAARDSWNRLFEPVGQTFQVEYADVEWRLVEEDGDG